MHKIKMRAFLEARADDRRVGIAEVVRDAVEKEMKVYSAVVGCSYPARGDAKA